jgi:hypothetical protein
VGDWKQMQEVFFFVVFLVDTPPSPFHSPPLSQIWTFTETDFMPGLPVNPLNSIVELLSALSVMGYFRSLREARPRGGRASPLCRWGPGRTGLAGGGWAHGPCPGQVRAMRTRCLGRQEGEAQCHLLGMEYPKSTGDGN